MSGLTQRVERGTIAQCCPSEQSVEDVFDNWAIFSTTSQVHSEVLEPNCCYVWTHGSDRFPSVHFRDWNHVNGISRSRHLPCPYKVRVHRPHIRGRNILRKHGPSTCRTCHGAIGTSPILVYYVRWQGINACVAQRQHVLLYGEPALSSGQIAECALKDLARRLFFKGPCKAVPCSRGCSWQRPTSWRNIGF